MMSWTERQRLMLRAMGLRVWARPEVTANATPASTPPAGLAVAGAVQTLPRAPRAGGSAASEHNDIPHRMTDAVASATTGSQEGAAANRPPLRPGPQVQTRSPPFATPPSSMRGPWPPAALAHPSTTWAALREAVVDCKACGLCHSRRQTVFGAGHEQAHWMVVGEAPGEQEDLQGLPFVGPAGQLLDAMLKALKLSREPSGPPEQRVFIANTLKCRPPGNRNPQPEELQQCEPFLVRQIALVQPRIILAMGRFALQTLLRSDEPVGRLRGRVHQYQGVPLVATYHPSYLLRNPLDKAKSWADLCLAAQTYEAGFEGRVNASR